MTDVHTSAGSRIYIGTTLATPNHSQSDYEADTYVEIAEVVTIGEFGRQYEQINHEPIANRARRKFKGVYDDGDLSLGLGKKSNDPGQLALKDALDDDADYNFKVVENDGADETTDDDDTVHYFKAKVMSFRTNIADVNSIVQATCSLGIKSGSHIEIEAS